MTDPSDIAALDWSDVRIGDPDPSAGMDGYRYCGMELTTAGGELDGGTFWCTREVHHVGRCVATDDVRVLAVGQVAT